MTARSRCGAQARRRVSKTAEALERACRHMTSKAREWVRACAEARKERDRLHEKHATAVLLEKCFLLQLDPATNAEYRAAVARVAAEVPGVEPLKVMESSLMISRLHRRGAAPADAYARLQFRGGKQSCSEKTQTVCSGAC